MLSTLTCNVDIHSIAIESNAHHHELATSPRLSSERGVAHAIRSASESCEGASTIEGTGYDVSSFFEEYTPYKDMVTLEPLNWTC